MCEFTFFTSPCQDNPPRPVRTSQCLLSKQGRECVHEDTRIELTPITCYMCIKRTEHERKEDAIKEKVEELCLECEHMGEYPPLSPEECMLCDLRAEVEGQMEFERRINDMRDDQGRVSPGSNEDGDGSVTSSTQSNVSVAGTSSSQSSDPGVEDKLLPVLNWEVPTRCFIDAGFIRMDPWAADREKQAMRAAMQKRAEYHGFQYTVPYPCPDDRENIDPLSRGPAASFLEFQQRANAFRASMTRRPFCPPGLCEVPTVRFQVALAPCCAKNSSVAGETSEW